MAWSDEDDDAIRNILVNWDKLSRGDIHVLYSVIKQPGAQMATVPGSANCIMWENFVRLGWAKPKEIPVPAPAKVFEVTTEGLGYLPRFIQQYDLKPGTFYRLRSGTDPA